MTDINADFLNFPRSDGNVTSKKITVDGIGSGTHYWKVVTTDNNYTDNSSTSYVRRFTIK